MNRGLLIPVILLFCVLALVGAGLIAGAVVLWRNLPVAASQLDAAQAVATQAVSKGAPKVGEMAPDFTLTGVDQKAWHLAQLRGQGVMVNFWATWCGPCSAEMSNIEKVFQAHKEDKFVLMSVDQGDKADAVQGFADIYHLTFPLLLDDNEHVGALYRIQALPTTVFIDPRGIIREIHIGGPMSVDFIESKLQALLK